MSELDLVAAAKRAEESVDFIEELFEIIGDNINNFGITTTTPVISTKAIKEAIDAAFLEVSIEYGDKVSREYFESNLDTIFSLVRIFSSKYSNSINASPLEIEYAEEDGKEPVLLDVFINHTVACFDNAFRPANVTLH